MSSWKNSYTIGGAICVGVVLCFEGGLYARKWHNESIDVELGLRPKITWRDVFTGQAKSKRAAFKRKILARDLVNALVSRARGPNAEYAPLSIPLVRRIRDGAGSQHVHENTLIIMEVMHELDKKGDLTIKEQARDV